MRCLFGLCGLMLVLAGCHVPAQMVWSPDGRQAGYRVGNRLLLIDENGKATAPSEPCSGGMCWSKDSGVFYHALEEPADRGMTHIVARRAGESKKLFELPRRPVFHMAISPDEKWLAVVQAGATKDDGCTLYVQHLESGKLRTISSRCALAMCFTGENRLALIEPDTHSGPAVHQPGRVVEVVLDEKAEKFDRKCLLNVLTDQAMWMQAIGENLLLSAPQSQFPSRATTRIDGVNKLFFFSRADGSVSAIADDVGPVFSVSPDQSQVMIEKLLVAEGKVARRQLVLIKPNGSDGRILRDLTGLPELPMWPSWRGATEIAFIPPIDINKPLRVEADETVRFDVVLYKLNEMYELQPERTLSESWQANLKPFYKLEGAPAPASQPTTQPAQ